MFTGLVETQGRIAGRTGTPDETALRVEAPFAPELRPGDSVAVDGVCLTVTAIGAGFFETLVSPETMRRTTLGSRDLGDAVNLERALRLGDRLGGHLVQGHVDGTAAVLLRRDEGSGARLTVELPRGFSPYVVQKGSLALDGVSLTVAERRPDAFEVALVPLTLERTTLGRRKPGDRLNLELDLIGRYVLQGLEERGRPGRRGITRELLAEQGFIPDGTGDEVRA
jgi:riboflavin synthase alpha subunit